MSTTPQTPRNTRALSATPWLSEYDHRGSVTPTNLPPAADAQDMLQLMRRNRGRIQGNVSFRNERSRSGDWLSAYCYVDTESSSLLFELTTQTTDPSFETLIPDLRACQVCAVFDDSIRTSVLEIVYFQNDLLETLQIRPERQTYFNSWYAALLCWQACQPNQNITRTADHTPQASHILRPFVSDERPRPLGKNERTNAPLRTERALLLTEGSPDFSNLEFPSNTTATEVFCVLRGTGEFSIHGIQDRRTLATVQLRALPRSAIQRLTKNVFGLARTLALYPQYATSQAACSSVRPIYLSFNFTDTFEVFFVLLRAFALPELHLVKPAPDHSPVASKRKSLTRSVSQDKARLFRLDHFFNVQIHRATLTSGLSRPGPEKYDTFHHDSPGDGSESSEYYVELLVDEQIKAKTTVRACVKSGLFWAENFDLFDLPSVVSSLSFRLKRRYIQGTGKAEMSDTASIMTSKTGMYVRTVHSALDTVEGIAEVDLDDLSLSKDKDLECEFLDSTSSAVGTLSVKLRREEHLVLAEEEYDHLTNLLLNFEKGVTWQIFDRTPLRPSDLANCLLNIFQATGTAETWLRSLIRDEVYDTSRHRRNPSSGRVDAAFLAKESETSASTRTNDALLLFRGNTLLTRALDSYMRRLGQSYLETTLRIKVQDIMDEDLDCEVDPSRLAPDSDHESNWQRLMSITKEMWSFIRHSAFQCPKELRRIFRFIRDMAADRFGDVMPSKVYTSVSSFLFLRFFCAAMLSPKMFGLLKGDPGLNAQRTYMLVAKSLQGLANMSTFGNKEHWMAPMNTFCSATRGQFESFIDSICDVDISDADPATTHGTQEGSDAKATAPVDEDAQAASQSEEDDQRPPRVDADTGVPVLRSRRIPSTESPRFHVYDPPSRPGSTATQIHIPSMRPPTRASLNSNTSSTAGGSAAGVSLPGSRSSSSPSGFNTEESVAYMSSFAIEDPLAESRSPSPEDENLRLVSEDRKSSDTVFIDSQDSEVDSRASIISSDTIVYIGPQDDKRELKSSYSRVETSDRARQNALRYLQGDSSTSDLVKKLESSAAQGEATETDARSAEGLSDNSSIYESASGRSSRKGSQGEHLSKGTMKPAAHSSGGTEAATGKPQPPLHKKDSHRDRTSAPLNDKSRPATPQTVISRPSTAHSVYSLKARPSLDLPPDDPLRLVLDRLPPHAREGFLSLPGLIDPAKNLALLVNLWLDSLEVRVHRAAAAAAARNNDDRASVEPILRELDDPYNNLARFHHICQELRDKAFAYRQSAERGQEEMEIDEEEENTGITAANIVVKWVSIAERMETSPHEFWVTRADDRPWSRASSSLYPATISSEEYARTTSSGGSNEATSPSSLYSAAPAPPNISRDRERGGKPRTGRISLFSSNSSTLGTKSGQSGKDKKGAKPHSISSGGSDKSGQESRSSAGKSSTKPRKKSPPRSAEDNAMRKLGWM